MTLFLDRDHDLLLQLLHTPTIGLLEATPNDPAPRLWQAQGDYAAAAEPIGLHMVRHDHPTAATVARDDVPRIVRDAVADPMFLLRQPNLVLRLGPALPPEATVMFNVHLDTVAGFEPVGFDGTRFTGRGAVDAKGPAVALLAGIRAAVAEEPRIGRDVAVLVQAVSGEEGGAMGTFGTRPLVEAGYVGRLNVFCEPTGLRWLPRATASMTARIGVHGIGSIDDRPDAGHNATVLLGFLAQHLATELATTRLGRACIAGLHTGDQHNRVYGTGQLLINLAYAATADGAELEKTVTGAVESGIRAFAERFAGVRDLARTARDAEAIVRLDWLKRGLPTLNSSAPWAEALLTRAGITPWPATEPAFTCDAIWMDGVPGAFTTVLGPGTLDGNNAHASGEYVELAELEAFASTVARLLTAFARTERNV